MNPQNNWQDRLEQQEFGGDQVHPSPAELKAREECIKMLDAKETPTKVTVELLEILLVKGWTIVSRQRGEHSIIIFIPDGGRCTQQHQTDNLAVLPPAVEDWASENLPHLVGGHPRPASQIPSCRADARAGGSNA